MLLKKYNIEDSKFISTNPLSAEGFVRIKKEQNVYSAVIQINNFSSPSEGYIVCGKQVKKVKITSSTTKIDLSFQLDIDQTCVILTSLKLFAVKSSTSLCEKAIKLIEDTKQDKSGNILDKVFGKVYDTYFFDMIKPKLASLFSLGSSVPELEGTYPQSRWTMVSAGGESKLIGIVYKDNFAYAIGVGDEQSGNVLNAKYFGDNLFNAELESGNQQKRDYSMAETYITPNYTKQNFNNSVIARGKTFSVLFLSANNGKFINI